MSDSMKAMYEAEERENVWIKNLKKDTSKSKVHELKSALQEIIDTCSFSKSEFNKLQEATNLLMEVTGERKYW